MDSRSQIEPRLKRGLVWRNYVSMPLLRISDNWIPVSLMVVAYFFAARLSFLFAVNAQSLSALWLPNAILMAAFLLLSRKSWLTVLLGVFVAHMLVQLLEHVPVDLALSRYVSNTAEALIGASAIRYFLDGEISFERLRDVCAFLFFGVICAPVCSSLLAVLLLSVLGLEAESIEILWRNHMLSNAVSVLAVAPVIVTSVQRRTLVAWWWSTQRLEACVLMALLLTICITGFVTGSLINIFHGALVFTLYPLLIWGALRFGSGFVAQLIFIVSLFGVWGAQHWQGPFVRAYAIENVLGLHFFILFTGAPLLLLTAVISEWRAADAAARNRKQQLDLALCAGKLNLWTWDIEFPFLTCNEQPTGAQENDGMLALPLFFRNIHPDDRQKLEHILKQALVANEPFELELRIAESGGDYRWYSSRGLWQLNDNGVPYRLLGANADISQHKSEYEQIQRQRDELAHLSRVAMLGEMSGAIAHELNQPLTAILCNAQATQRMLRKSSPGENEVAEILADIVSESKRAGEIILRLREFIKKGPAKLLPISLDTIVGKAIALERSDLISKSVAIKANLTPALPMVMIDSVQILQVLLNLIINACDAMQGRPTNERLIQISTSRSDEAALLIAVSDRGKGIADDQLETIFDPFVTSKPHGLGLGLTICRSIVEAHGGSLWAINNRDGGATFTLTLPIADN